MTKSGSADTLPPDIDRIRAVIFDMDGTLIRHTWKLDQITEALFNRFADDLAPVTHDEFYQLYWPKNEDMWYMMVDGVLDGETAAKYGYINTLRVLGKDTSLAPAMAACWKELVLEEAVPFEDTFTVLDTVRRHYTTGILTNGFTSLQRGKINRYNLGAHVDFTLVSEEVGAHKPDKKIFLKALQLAGNVPAEQALYIGDTLVADIQGAKQAGLIPVLINPEDDLDPPDGVPKIKQLSELLTLLNLEAPSESK